MRVNVGEINKGIKRNFLEFVAGKYQGLNVGLDEVIEELIELVVLQSCVDHFNDFNIIPVESFQISFDVYFFQIEIEEFNGSS